MHGKSTCISMKMQGFPKHTKTVEFIFTSNAWHNNTHRDMYIKVRSTHAEQLCITLQRLTMDLRQSFNGGRSSVVTEINASIQMVSPLHVYIKTANQVYDHVAVHDNNLFPSTFLLDARRTKSFGSSPASCSRVL